MRRLAPFLVVALTVAAGCTGSEPLITSAPPDESDAGTASDAPSPPPPPAETKLAIADPPPAFVTGGTTEKIKIGITRTGVLGDVTIAASNPPLGVSIAPVVIPEGVSEAELTVDAAVGAAQIVANVKLDASSATGGGQASTFLPLTVRGKPGDLDVTFTGGVVPAGTGSPSDFVSDATGRLYVLSGQMSKCLVRRFTPDGKADQAFGTGGIVSFDEFGFSCSSVAAQDDGKVLLGGIQLGGLGTGVLARVLPNGDRDAAFGANGVRSFGGTNAVEALRIDASKRIVMTARSNEDVHVLRLGADGAPDATFTATSLPGVTGSSLAIAPDGSLRVAVSNADTFVLATVPSAGSGDVGKLLSLDSPLGAPDRSRAVIVDPTGRAILAGHTTSDSVSRFVLARVAAGVLDPSFGANGGGFANVEVVGSVHPGAVALEPASGRIVAIGHVETPSAELVIARFTPDGKTDNAFGKLGVVRTSVAASYVVGAVVQDQRFVVGCTQGSDAVLVRFWR